MVFMMVTRNDNVMPPFIVPHGFTLSTEAYIKCLEEVVLLWIEREPAGRSFVWQQDDAQSHKSRKRKFL